MYPPSLWILIKANVAKDTVAYNGVTGTVCCWSWQYLPTLDCYTTRLSNLNMDGGSIKARWNQPRPFYWNCSKIGESRTEQNHCYWWLFYTYPVLFCCFRLVVLLLLTGVIAVLAIYLYFDTQGSRERLRSLLGMFILLGLGFVFSKHITKVI